MATGATCVGGVIPCSRLWAWYHQQIGDDQHLCGWFHPPPLHFIYKGTCLQNHKFVMPLIVASEVRLKWKISWKKFLTLGSWLIPALTCRVDLVRREGTIECMVFSLATNQRGLALIVCGYSMRNTISLLAIFSANLHQQWSSGIHKIYEPRLEWFFLCLCSSCGSLSNVFILVWLSVDAVQSKCNICVASIEYVNWALIYLLLQHLKLGAAPDNKIANFQY